MKKTLSYLAGIVGILTLVVWLATGAHPGWTKTQVTEMQIDPITELNTQSRRTGLSPAWKCWAEVCSLDSRSLADHFYLKSNQPGTERQPDP